MFGTKLYLILFLRFFQESHCQRRITGGSQVETEKKYAVYLLMAPDSTMSYDTWLCGGALVTSQFILSSAACVIDIDFMYAIAGYKENVPDSRMEEDQCTKHKKKRVIYRCYPKKYELKYDELDYWSYIDIALLKVDEPYHKNDATFQVQCSYIPEPISVNYEAKFQEAGVDAIVMGWGHSEIWRKEWDLESHNEKYLKYIPISIQEKEMCVNAYLEYPNMTSVIEEYMICGTAGGNLDETGKLIVNETKPKEPLLDGCDMQDKLRGYSDIECIEERKRLAAMNDDTRRGIMNSNQTNNASAIDIIHNTTRTIRTMKNFRRSDPGICQNDHGGPLITWKGGREVLIGVASVFKVNNDSECIGPFLFTSTSCTATFIDCVLRYEARQNRHRKREKGHSRTGDNDLCNAPASVKGYETVESHISWQDHPAGPGDNENMKKKMARNRNSNESGGNRFGDKKKKKETDVYEVDPKTKYKELQRKAALKRQAAMEKHQKEEMEAQAAIERQQAMEKKRAMERQIAIDRQEAMKVQAAVQRELAVKREAAIERHEAIKIQEAIQRQTGMERQAASQRSVANKYIRDPYHDPKRIIARDPTYDIPKQFVPVDKLNDGLEMRPMRPIRF